MTQLSPHEQRLIDTIKQAGGARACPVLAENAMAENLVRKGILARNELGFNGQILYRLVDPKPEPEPIDETTLRDYVGRTMENYNITINNPSDAAAADLLIERGYWRMVNRDSFGNAVVCATPKGVDWYHATSPISAPKPDSTGIQAILDERQTTYGSYRDVAHTAQSLKRNLAVAQNRGMKPFQLEALEMICNKLARIVNGDPNYVESWRDLSGYAQLVVNELLRTEGATDGKVIRQKVIDGTLTDI